MKKFNVLTDKKYFGDCREHRKYIKRNSYALP